MPHLDFIHFAFDNVYDSMLYIFIPLLDEMYQMYTSIQYKSSNDIKIVQFSEIKDYNQL